MGIGHPTGIRNRWLGAGLLALGAGALLTLACTRPLWPVPFNAHRWRAANSAFTGGQGWSVSLPGEVSRLQMTDSLLRDHLRNGMDRTAVLTMLGASQGEGGGSAPGEGSTYEAHYSLVSQPTILDRPAISFRYRSKEPGLLLEFKNERLVRATIE